MKAPVKNQNDEVINLVGFRFREIRKENGWTLSEVSKRTGISKGTLSKLENGKTQLCHTLNGSAMALPRVLAALLENHQTPEGIKIPEALVSYTGFDIIK